MVQPGKDSKKKKAKKAKAVPIHAFDLDSISLDDIKIYVTKLEKELALMRKDCAFYSANKDNMVKFLVTMRKVCSARNQDSIVKNSHLDDLIEKLRRFPESHNEKSIISDKGKARKKQEKMFSDFLQRSTAEAEHFDEEYALKKQISDIENKLQHNRYFHEATKMDRKELFRNAQQELDNKYSDFLENSLKQYVKEGLKYYQDFSSDKVKLLTSIWSTKEQSDEMRELFLNEIKEIQDFFYEISSNNNEVVKMLKNRLEVLLTEEKKLKLNLKEVVQENMKFQEIQPPGFYESNTLKAPVTYLNHKKDIQIEKKLQALQFQNEVLTEKLRNMKENWKDLNKDFIVAIRRIHQEADFKAQVLEEIIKREWQIQSMKLENEEPKPLRKKTQIKEGEEHAVINTFSMRVEDSDTLFVPPVYHEFWDPSLRKQFRGNH